MIKANELLFHSLTDRNLYRWIVACSMKKDLNRIGVNHIDCVITQNGQTDDSCDENSIVDLFGDKTGYEMFKNEWNYRKGLLFCFKGFRTRLLMLRMSILQDYLKRYFPDRRFVIIGLVCENETQVRFHENREDEAWLAPDIDGYKEEEVIVLC